MNEEAFQQSFSATKAFLLDMEKIDEAVTQYGRGFGNFYTLWSLVALTPNLPTPAEFAGRYAAFMTKVEELAGQQDLEAFLREKTAGEYSLALAYLNNSRGASTDSGPRKERLTALKAAVIG